MGRAEARVAFIAQGAIRATALPKARLLLKALKMAATYSPTMRSTIGVAELNDPVRNGKGWDLSAITT